VVKPAVAAVNPSPTNTPSASKTTNTITFAVEGYEITGNTLFRYADLEPIFKKFVGPAVGFETIRQALAEFQMAYRNRGFVTVSVTLPPQQLTNGLVKVKVVEGRLKEINVVNNHYFSSNNIMRALPSLQTNILLNSLVFQRDLDRANGNRDRQIYPVIGPGPEPGTTALNLKVKDRLPLHWRMELNDYSTPNTPELRLNTSAQYNNLWQLEHQVGLQYSFTPEAMKDVNQLPAFYDQPLIANYSAFYRMPLDFGKAKDRGRPLQISDFGYDEVTKRFRPPPAGEFPDLIFYASRSFSDTGLGLQSESVTQPSDFDTNGGLQVTDQVLSQTLVKNESLGSRISVPLSDFAGFRSSLSGGLDYKSYRSEILQREQFTGLIRVPVQGRPGEFDIIPVPNPPPPTDKTTHHSVQYLPLTVAYDISKADKWGLTAFNLSASFNISALFDSKRDFQSTAGSSKADGNYAILIPGLTREQKLFSGSPNRGDIGDWAIRIRADGQWANQPLINNEQFGIGGLAGVRGYHDGQEYGDTGWRTIVEPHTPLLKIGMVDETLPMYMRFFAFNDYGRRYLLAPSAGRDTSLGLWGAGFGFNAVIGDHWDFRFALGFPLLDVPGVKAGNPRALFSISAQF
jgi:hemolysin activation/secretion protein